MLANVTPPTNDFLAIARYLIYGKPGSTPHPDRVQWILTRHLATDDPELAATYMAATARLSKRARNAAYHAIISWHHSERPSPKIMQEIAAATLELAGLGDHEALVIGHGDKPHPHLHMLVNRVHPVTGRAWDTSHDYRRFDAIMRRLSDVYGFRYAPAHRFHPDLTDDLPRKPPKAATYAAMRGAFTGRLQWSQRESRQFGAAMSDELDRASTLADLEAAFACHGLRLESKGSGFVVGNDASYTKLSALRLQSTAKDFGKRFLRPLIVKRTDDHPRRWFDMDEVEFIRAMASLGLADKHAVERTVAKVTSERQARMAQAPLMVQISRSLLKATTSLCVPARSTKPARRIRSAPKPSPIRSR